MMTSFVHVIIPTRGNWFQTNPLEHESDDRAGNTVDRLSKNREEEEEEENEQH